MRKDNTNAETRKNRRNNMFFQEIKEHRKVITIVLLVCILIWFSTVAAKLVSNPTKTFLVEQGQIYQEETATGYIIRDETVVKGNKYKNGMVQIKTEGEKVAKGEAIFRYYTNGESSLVKKIEELDKKINEAMEKEDKLSSGDTKVLENQIADKIESCYTESDLQKIKENKKDINSSITKKAKIAGELSPAGSYLKKLVDERKKYENSLNSGAEYVTAPRSGVVSYKVDGLEDMLTTKDFGGITKNFLESLNVKIGQVVTSSEESGKIIDNYECYIATILDSEYAKKAEVGQKVKVRLPSGNEISAEIEYINSQDGEDYVLVFKIEKNIDELIAYRKISLNIIWWSESGKKIPNTAIRYEEKGKNEIAYVIRTRAGYQEKIWIKEKKSNGKYTIVSDYTSEELKNLGLTTDEIKSRKTLSLYDEILTSPQILQLCYNYITFL